MLVRLYVVLFAGALLGQPLPKFEDFPVTKIFKGRPALPKLVTPRAKSFRTMIRRDAAEGPNFAGQFTIALWGCGSCLSMAIVNAVDGTVYPAPFSTLADFFPGADYAGPPDHSAIDFRLTSWLLFVRGCPDEDKKACASYFYEWTGKELKLLRKIPPKLVEP